MPYLLVLLLALAHIQGRWPAPPEWLGGRWAAIATWAGFLAIGLWNAVAIWRLRERLHAEPNRRIELYYTFARQRKHFFLIALGFYLAALYLVGWGYWVKEGWSHRLGLAPGVELLLLSPFLVTLAAGWFANHSFEKALHESATFQDEPFLGRRAYFALMARQNLLILVPMVFFLLLQEGVYFAVPSLRADSKWTPYLFVALITSAMMAIPWILRFFLGLKPLPAGPLRDRLAQAAQRAHFRFSDIYVWNTRGQIANAMVTGIFPFFRYIVLTDKLIDGMTHDEIEGVFGHEVGHIKHHHLLFYFVFMVGSLALLGGVFDWAGKMAPTGSIPSWFESWLPAGGAWKDLAPSLTTLPLILCGAIYFFIVFGFLSRRCERQADLFGCKVAGAEAFISALERVAVLNGISRDQPGWLSSWQHSTIGKRVDFLRKLQIDPAIASRFQWRFGILKWLVVAAAVGAVWLFGSANLFAM